MIISALAELLLIAMCISAPVFLAGCLVLAAAEAREAIEGARSDLRAIEEKIAMQQEKLDQLSRGILFAEQG